SRIGNKPPYDTGPGPARTRSDETDKAFEFGDVFAAKAISHPEGFREDEQGDCTCSRQQVQHVVELVVNLKTANALGLRQGVDHRAPTTGTVRIRPEPKPSAAPQ